MPVARKEEGGGVAPADQLQGVALIDAWWISSGPV